MEQITHQSILKHPLLILVGLLGATVLLLVGLLVDQASQQYSLDVNSSLASAGGTAWVELDIKTTPAGMAWYLTCPEGPYSCNGKMGAGNAYLADPSCSDNGPCAGQGEYWLRSNQNFGYDCIESTANRDGTSGTKILHLTLHCTPVPGVPTIMLSASPTAVNSGSGSTLTWSSTNATSCVAAGGWTGARPVSGTEVSSPLARDTTFSLTCTGSGGSATKSVIVGVLPGISCSARTSKTTVKINEPFTGYWSSTAATHVSGKYDGPTLYNAKTLKSYGHDEDGGAEVNGSRVIFAKTSGVINAYGCWDAGMPKGLYADCVARNPHALCQVTVTVVK